MPPSSNTAHSLSAQLPPRPVGVGSSIGAAHAAGDGQPSPAHALSSAIVPRCDRLYVLTTTRYSPASSSISSFAAADLALSSSLRWIAAPHDAVGLVRRYRYIT